MSNIGRRHTQPAAAVTVQLSGLLLGICIGGKIFQYEIIVAFLQKTDNQYELKEATLYTAFRRLEENGCIVSYWGDENTGARRRYYSISSEGRKTYDKLKKEWEVAKKIIDKLIDEESIKNE